MMFTPYNNPTEAFEKLYDFIMINWVCHSWTKAIYNAWFYILHPSERIITTPRRWFSTKYAEREWKWYLSWDPSWEKISKYAPIWKNYMDENWNINSNYWRQRQRNWQLDYVINELKRDKSSRRALISIYDGKEHDKYSKDTPCTCFLQFQILEWKLCMTVAMRSNDLIYGFCNDQYQFSKLQELIANEVTNWDTWWYYHFATNLHIYEKHFTIKKDYEKKNI